jgi:uncharacterized protein YndB with AHSA1/START domain
MKSPESSTADREIIVSRLLDAPRELVFEVWVDPKHVVHWWGPNGFTNTIHEMEVKPGGVWRFMMHGPDGVDYPNRVVFEEVVRPERLVYIHDDDGEGAQKPFHVTTTFEDQVGKTLLTMRLVLDSPEERGRLAEFGAIEGGKQTLGRLAEYLKNLSAT